MEIGLIELSKENVGRKKRFNNIAGILIATVCRTSFNLGFFGFASLIPKTRLIDHCKKMYGFGQYGRHLAVDLEKSQLLITKYLEHAG